MNKIFDDFKRSHRVRSQESGVRSQESGVRRKKRKKEEKLPIIVQILFIVNPYIRSFLILNSGLLILKLSKNYHFPRFFLLPPSS